MPFKTEVNERLAEHIEKLKTFGWLPKDWHWHRDKVLELEEISEQLINDLSEKYNEIKESVRLQNKPELLKAFEKPMSQLHQLHNILERLLNRYPSAEQQEKESRLVNNLMKSIRDCMEEYNAKFENQEKMNAAFGPDTGKKHVADELLRMNISDSMLDKFPRTGIMNSVVYALAVGRRDDSWRFAQLQYFYPRAVFLNKLQGALNGVTVAEIGGSDTKRLEQFGASVNVQEGINIARPGKTEFTHVPAGKRITLNNYRQFFPDTYDFTATCAVLEPGTGINNPDLLPPDARRIHDEIIELDRMAQRGQIAPDQFQTQYMKLNKEAEKIYSSIDWAKTSIRELFQVCALMTKPKGFMVHVLAQNLHETITPSFCEQIGVREFYINPKIHVFVYTRL